MLLCIDVGNTHAHFGLVENGQAQALRQLPTREIDHPAGGFAPRLAQLFGEYPQIGGVAFCSVVPEATERLERVLARARLPCVVFQLTCEKKLGLPISYPRPREIGQDRLANAAGAHALVGSPAVVIDLGTAVTFDIITRQGGYEGGIIAPGVEVMRRYLHEQTALLPLLDDNIEVPRSIGQSTMEAMRIGTVIGFGGMIQALLAAVLKELAARGETPPTLLATGGSAELLQRTLQGTRFQVVPDLTLRGLAAAWALNQTSEQPRNSAG